VHFLTSSCALLVQGFIATRLSSSYACARHNWCGRVQVDMMDTGKKQDLRRGRSGRQRYASRPRLSSAAGMVKLLTPPRRHGEPGAHLDRVRHRHRRGGQRRGMGRGESATATAAATVRGTCRSGAWAMRNTEHALAMPVAYAPAMARGLCSRQGPGPSGA
jgi:hypothetical protein